MKKDKKEIGNVSTVNIKKTVEIVGGENLYLIVSLVFFLILVVTILFFGFIYFMQPGALLSPPENIGSFLLRLNSDVHGVVYGDRSSLEENELIKDFVLNYLEDFKISEISDSDSLIIGLSSSFTESPYLDFLKDNDSIAVYDADVDSLYVYSKDLKGLEQILDILKNEQQDYVALEIKDGMVSELEF